MTTKPQGVAGRVVSSLKAKYDFADLVTNQPDYEAGLVDGAERLHAELSAEARAILAEQRAKGNWASVDWLHCEIFQRLGLAIDHDETEGE